jgi:flagellar assembly protein FliH
MSSSADYNGVVTLPIAALEYRDMAGHLLSEAGTKSPARAVNGIVKRRSDAEASADELAERITRERADATRQTEQRLRQEFEAQLQAARAPIAAAIAAFESQRVEYFARVEAEVVRLALAIAAKILHREAQVDPMLVAALVRMTIEKMREGSSVTVRVSPGRAPRWRELFASHTGVTRVEVSEDPDLTDQDCLLETELGVANFGLDTQLKEVEKGFFDLLALRPESK